ncbi:MAG: 50S ribosomal protein L25 [Thermoleophilia bacterium]
MKKVKLAVKERDSFGSPEARRMRKSGWIPAVLYGDGESSKALAVEEKALKHALGRERGNVILSLTIEGSKDAHAAILKEYQPDPLGRGILHVDFLEVSMDKPIEASIHLELTGTPQGVKDGGILDQSHRELQIRCLPGDMPSSIEYDVSEMVIGDSIRVSDLTPPPGVEILSDSESGVASVLAPKLVVEEVTEEEAEEGAEAAAEGAPAEEKPAEGGGE